MLSRLVIAFLPRSKHLLISWLQWPSAVILEPKKIKSVTCQNNHIWDYIHYMHTCSVASHSLWLHGLWLTCQAFLSMKFSREEYWSGLSFPFPGALFNPGIEPASPVSPALAGRFFTTEPPGKPALENRRYKTLTAIISTFGWQSWYHFWVRLITLQIWSKSYLNIL